MRYRPEIDGLRAIAVIPVILFHAGFGFFGGGFIGVDVFFVISGYLITGLLLEELAGGQFSLLRFYERRARRILPALAVVVTACIPFALAWMHPLQMEDFSASLIAIVLSASNFLFWYESGYFAPAADEKPLLHTWSLAVEEQFYIFFPIFLFVLWRFARDRTFLTVAAIAVASLLLSEWGWRHWPTANFYLMPTRAWELFAGSLCAQWSFRREQRPNGPLGAFGLALIVAAVFLFDGDTPFPSALALAPVVGTALIILFAGPGTAVARLLSSRLLVGIGLISYSAYLWHQPLLAFARVRSAVAPSLWLMASLATLSFALAYLSWRFVEQPFRKRSPATKRGGTIKLVIFGAVIGAALAGVGLAGVLSKGFLHSFEPFPYVAEDEFRLPTTKTGYCFYFVLRSDLPVGEEGLNCFVGDPAARKDDILLFGDSFAGHWEPFFDVIGRKYGRRIHSVTTNWCFPSLTDNIPGPRPQNVVDQCRINRDYLRNNASRYDIIVLSAQWSGIEESGFTQDLFDLIDFLLENTRARIVVMASPLALVRNTVENSVLSGMLHVSPDPKSQERIDAVHRRIAAVASGNDRITFLDENDLFGDYFGSGGLETAEGYLYSLDGKHISIYGSKAAARHVITTRNHSFFSALALPQDD
ncbi:MAG: acyltransferase [Ahrensia sp.]|nr:acyltransferase [Ahrensia sp.]|tara:strand:+ start:11724 stop:13658 length:1935 start_codon:yes stop_codon:yes gene_type:complete